MSALPTLGRLLRLRDPMMTGKDVEAVRRGCIRYLDDAALWQGFVKMPVSQRRTFGDGMEALVRKTERKAKIVADGVAGPALNRVLDKAGAYDANCYKLFAEWHASQIVLCYPHPQGHVSTVCQKLHRTSGLRGNWAYDFCAPGGTPVVAVVAAEVVKISGHPPDQVIDPSLGIFGWNLYYTTPDGYRWFSTHYGFLSARVGQKLRVGQQVGTVGHWPLDPGRSHTHLGVTSPHSETDAKAWIQRVANAPKVKL